MKLAFYAPLKPPGHPVASGDRAMARGIIAALERTGARITLASTLRSRNGQGDPQAQAALIDTADALLPALIRQGRAEGWKAWLTYHTYYKAPDLIGWQVAAALDIPYLQIEATRARKRLTGPWAQFAKIAEHACDQAAVIFYLTARDAEALTRDAPKGQKLFHLRPFLNSATLPARSTLNGPMLSVGMMRQGDKLASYTLIAETLALLPRGGWQLNVAGDGPARGQVSALMAPFGDAVTFLGALKDDALAGAYGDAALLFWPGVNEAFGMSYLEAQAAGLPVVAQDRPGVRDVLAPGTYPAPEAGPAALAARLLHFLNNRRARAQASAIVCEHIENHHLLPAAAETLRDGLRAAGVGT